MKIHFTKHAKKKLSDLHLFGITVTKSKITKTIKKPKYHSLDNSKSIVASSFDKTHNLRVVYRPEKNDIIVITFYVYRKGRYGES